MKFSWLVAISVIIFTLCSNHSAFAACTSPTGAEGDILFNSSSGNVMQSCGGAVWKGWPKAIAGTWKSISSGTYHSCGIKGDNSLYCWGKNNNGQVGNGTSGADVLYPVQVSGAWSMVGGQDDGGANPGQSCGIKTNGTAYCWGSNENLQGGFTTTGSSSTPRALSAGGTWKMLAVGAYAVCGIKATDSSVWCWGKDDQGERGDGAGDSGSSSTGARESTNSTWTQIVGGADYTASQAFCGIKTDGTGWCWGDNQYGQLGDGTTTDRFVPTAISVTGVTTWKMLAAGDGNACGIKTDNTLWCWGDNSYGAIGNGSVGPVGTKVSTPVQVSTSGVTTWKSVGVGSSSACGVKTDDTGWCWGYGQEGNIGDGGTTDRGNPVQFWPGTTWKMLTAAAWPTCGIMLNGTLWCWGENQNGGIGVGATGQRNTPSYVAGSSATTCSSPTGAAGDMLFNGAYRVLQWCDGQQWNPAGPISPSGPLAGCTSPTGTSGDLLYNSAYQKMQYCDGDTWRVVGADLVAPTAGLVHYWKLDETSGTTVADSAGSNPGTMLGSMTAAGATVAGKFGTAMSFNGTTNYINTGVVPEIINSSKFTISAWLKRRVSNSDVHVVTEAGANIGVGYYPNTNVYYDVTANTGSFTDGYAVLNDTNWHLITMVYDGTQTGNSARLKGYVDGVLVSLSFDGTIPAVSAVSPWRFYLGYYGGDNKYADGSIDDVRIYNRTLSAAEVMTLYQATGGN